MKVWRLIAAAVGVACLIWLVRSIDLHQVAQTLADIQPGRALLFLCIFPLAVCCDTIAWIEALIPARLDGAWFRRLWGLLMVSEAMQTLTPFGALAGEPAKALLLQRRFRVPLADATASLAIMQVLMAIGQLPFILGGIVIVLTDDVLPPLVNHILVGFICAMMLFLLLTVLALHQRWLQRLHGPISQRLAHMLEPFERIEHQLADMVRSNPRRIAVALSATCCNWMLFTVEMWVSCWALGEPVSYGDAWAMEAVIVIVRNATFFIPAHLGAQDGATTFVFAALVHNPTLGLASAAVRRLRELLWAVFGMALGARLGWQRVVESPAPASSSPVPLP